MPKKKSTLEKVAAVVTGVSESVKNVSEIVEGVVGTVSEVAQTLRQQEGTLSQKGAKPLSKKVVQKPRPAATARAKPQSKTPKAATGTKARASRQKTTKR
jgi:uncharacterized protein YoxC